MNNSFARLIDGMCATLRTEVLTRLDDDFARGQVYGVINLLNTFRVRADWSPAFLASQIAAQRQAFEAVRALLAGGALADELPALPEGAVAEPVSASDLLAQRDAGNLALGRLLQWLDERGSGIPPGTAAAIEEHLRAAMRAEIELELKNAPRPLFAEMSSGREG